MDRSGFRILSTLCLSHLGPFQHKLDSGHGQVGDICPSHPLTWEISFAGERRLICFTATLSPGGQRVKVGETVGGGVEKHQSVEWGCFLTKRQEKCFSSVEEDNLIRIIRHWSPHSHLADQVEQLLWSDDAALKHFQAFAHLHLGSLGLKSVFVRNNNSFRRSMQSLILCCVELRIVPQPRCPPSLVFPMLCFCHSWGQTCCTAGHWQGSNRKYYLY